VRLPAPGRLFEVRAARLTALAAEHAIPEWLRLLSRVAAGQAAAVRDVHVRPPAVRAGRPLDHAALPPDETWRRMLAVIVQTAWGLALPAPTQETLRALAATDAAALDGLGRAVLAGALAPDQAAAAPFVGAALETWFAAVAATLAVTPEPPESAGACPVCGGPPVAGVIRKDDRRRDVTCAVCATTWDVPRVRCVACDTSAGPEYFHVDAEPGLKAEACPTCRAYLKLFDEERRADVDPAADDAATLALDLLLAEEGFHRAGPNLYLGG
jgi:FdhE protein